jgi:chitodextrinase
MSIFLRTLGVIDKCIEINILRGRSKPPAPPPDTVPPTQPGSLKVTNITNTSVTVTWTASTDNVGVDKYQVYIFGTGWEHFTTLTNHTFHGLIEGRHYKLGIRALDAAGKSSPYSLIDFDTKTTDVTPLANQAHQQSATSAQVRQR